MKALFAVIATALLLMSNVAGAQEQKAPSAEVACSNRRRQARR